MVNDKKNRSLRCLFVFLSIIGIVLIAGCVSDSGSEQESECKGEGESIPVIASPPSCCAGLTLISPKQEMILGISGICTANCGDGVCNESSESSYNCPVDCEEEPASVNDSTGLTGLANPAAVYCVDLGYTLDGAGNCIFSDNTSCEQWDFWRGKCGASFTYCESQGFTLENRTDNMGTWSSAYAVCIFDDGSECEEHDYMRGDCAPSLCSEWNASKGGCVTE